MKITSVSRTKYGEYKEYHTSHDNFDLVTRKVYLVDIMLLRSYRNYSQKILKVKYCATFLTKKKLYPTLSRADNKSIKATNFLDFIQYSDGNNSLEKISLLIKVDIKKVKIIYKNLKNTDSYIS